MFNIAKKTFAYGAHQVTLETGEVARQAGAAIMVSMGDTVVLVSVVGNKAVKPWLTGYIGENPVPHGGWEDLDINPKHIDFEGIATFSLSL